MAKMIKYPVKSRGYTRFIFRETVKTSGVVRFFAKMEQIAQISKKGIHTKIMEKILLKCIESKWAEASSKSLFETFGTDTTKSDLGVAILECAAVVVSGFPL